MGEDLRVRWSCLWFTPAGGPPGHRNAPLSETGRLRLARCVIDDGWPLRRAAERFQVSVNTAKRWAERNRADGPSGMADRSSRPHRSPNRTRRRSSAKTCTYARSDGGDRPGSPAGSAYPRPLVMRSCAAPVLPVRLTSTGPRNSRSAATHTLHTATLSTLTSGETRQHSGRRRLTHARRRAAKTTASPVRCRRNCCTAQRTALTVIRARTATAAAPYGSADCTEVSTCRISMGSPSCSSTPPQRVGRLRPVCRDARSGCPAPAARAVPALPHPPSQLATRSSGISSQATAGTSAGHATRSRLRHAPATPSIRPGI